MVYQDHLTKYCLLRPLTSKRAVEVAFQVMNIFLMYGAPQILQSDNGSDFTALVISELKLLWPDMLIVHGKPRHLQCQGSVERLNCDIKDMLISWLGDNDTSDWPMSLKFMQFHKNTSYHSGIKQFPYKALFGVEAKVGLRSTTLPEVLKKMLLKRIYLELTLSSRTLLIQMIHLSALITVRTSIIQILTYIHSEKKLKVLVTEPILLLTTG